MSMQRLNAPTATYDPRLRNLTNRDVASSLMLQQLLYYHFYYDCMWLTFQIAWAWNQYHSGIFYTDPCIVRTVFLILWLISEPLRMFSGWYGNLQENIFWLFIFFALSIFPQQATILYLFIAAFDIGPWVRAVQFTQWLMYYTEIGVVVYTMIRLFKRQTRQYYLFEYAVNQRRRFPVVPGDQELLPGQQPQHQRQVPITT